MTEKRREAIAADRIPWLDNLRTFMIFLVVVFHSGLVYESSGIGAGFWIVDDPSTTHLSGILNLLIDIFAMATIFFVSGFLTPLSPKHKRGGEFLKSRFKRLMIPWAASVLTLIPLYKVIFLYSRGLPQESWATYFHWSNGIWSQNWLWFLPVLFLFDMAYLFFSGLNAKSRRMTLKGAIGLAFLIGLIYSLCIDILGLQGWTKTVLVDFQNERVLIYFMTFLIGSLCCELKTFESEPRSKRHYILVSFAMWITTCLYLFLVIHFLINPGHCIFSGVVDSLLIRVTFLLTLLTVMYWLVNTFRWYLNKKGRVGRELNRNSYAVYMIHVIVLGSIALLLLDTTIMSLLKYPVLAISTYAVSNLLVSAHRKVVGLKISITSPKYRSA